MHDLHQSYAYADIYQFVQDSFVLCSRTHHQAVFSAACACLTDWQQPVAWQALCIPAEQREGLRRAPSRPKQRVHGAIRTAASGRNRQQQSLATLAALKMQMRRARMPPANPAAFQQRHHEVSGVINRWQHWRRPQSGDRAPACHASLQNARRGSDLSTAAAAGSAAPPLVADAAAGSESLDLSSQLELQNIRDSLIRQEDTIIFCIIERAQFAANAPVYQPDAVPVPQFDASGRRYSLLEYILRKTEDLHGSVRRFTSPDEHAFYPEAVPSLVLPPLKYPEVLAPYAKDININAEVMGMYLQHLLPGISRDEDDGNYGSSACYDVLCLQALSKRIHYGKFVAEAKFRSQRATYAPLIERRDVEGIMDALTDRAVELKVVDRVRWKAATYGQDAATPQQPHSATADGGSLSARYKVAPETVAMLYDKWVMPMTKQVQSVVGMRLTY